MSEPFLRPASPPDPSVTYHPLTEPANYMVQPGDTLYSIARAHGIPLSVLIAANPSIDMEKPAEGQLINIPYLAAPPECPEGFVPYTAVAGDTMQKLAQKHNIPLSALLAANPAVEADGLLIGQTVCVPQ